MINFSFLALTLQVHPLIPREREKEKIRELEEEREELMQRHEQVEQEREELAQVGRLLVGYCKGAGSY